MACVAVPLENWDAFGDGKKQHRLVSFKYVAAATCLKEVERMFGDIL